MTLLNEFKDATARWAERTSNITHDEIADELAAKQVHYDILDTLRWGELVQYVYQRGDEFVSVTYSVGSGDSEYDYEPEFQAVKPVEVTVVQYEKIVN